MSNFSDYMNTWLNNPLTQVGMGLLGGNVGGNKKEALANAMRGGLLGMESARRNQITERRLGNEEAWKQMQFGQMQQQQEAEKRETEQLQQWAASNGMNPNMPKAALMAAYKQSIQGQTPPTGMRVGANGGWEYDPNYLAGQAKLRAAGATTLNNYLAPQTPGQKKLDEKAAESIAGFESGGEYADTAKMIKQLEGVQKQLQDSDNLSGWLVGNMPDAIATVVNPEAVQVREDIEEVVQRNLKAVLGAQFTEKEGERLIKRAYNPRLSEEENLKRVNRLLAQMKTSHAAKQSAAKYMRENGSVIGWGGEMPKFQDFYDALDQTESSDQPAISKKDLKPGMSMDGYRYKGGDPSNPNSWVKQ